jgi:hypothetical protein
MDYKLDRSDHRPDLGRSQALPAVAIQKKRVLTGLLLWTVYTGILGRQEIQNESDPIPAVVALIDLPSGTDGHE